MVSQEIRELLLSAQQGNEEAFNEIYRRYYQSAFIKANSLCHNEADAKDAVQDAFLQAYRSLKDLKELDHFYSWLIMIVINKCKNQFHKYRLLNSTSRDVESNQTYREERIYMDPKKYTENEIEHDILMKIISSLTLEQAELVNMIYFQHMKLAEVANVLDIPLGTVKTRSLKAKKDLQKKINEFEKVEQRKLNFHADAIIPTILLSSGFFKDIFFFTTSKIKDTTSYVSNHATMAICTTSLTALSITGASFIYEDIQERRAANLPQTQPINTAVQTTPQEQVNIPLSAFPSTTYQEQIITSSKEAFYTCINSAQTIEELELKTPEEIQEITKLYEALKQENALYYKNLEKLGWNTMFESFLY